MPQTSRVCGCKEQVSHYGHNTLNNASVFIVYKLKLFLFIYSCVLRVLAIGQSSYRSELFLLVTFKQLRIFSKQI